MMDSARDPATPATPALPEFLAETGLPGFNVNINVRSSELISDR